MTIDGNVADRLKGRSQTWRLGASCTAASRRSEAGRCPGFPKASGGFAGDAATYHTLGHSLAMIWTSNTARRPPGLGRFCVRPWGIFLKSGHGVRVLRQGAISIRSPPPVHLLFGTKGSVLHRFG